MSEGKTRSPVELAVELTNAWLTNPSNRADTDEVQSFLRTTHTTLTTLSAEMPAPDADVEASPAPVEYPPAVSVKKSLGSKDHILSMIDGKPYKTLRRHLATRGLTPDSYRERYNLKPDYPMVAPNYSEQRSVMARKLGLGKKPDAAKGTPKAKASGKA